MPTPAAPERGSMPQLSRRGAGAKRRRGRRLERLVGHGSGRREKARQRKLMVSGGRVMTFGHGVMTLPKI